MTRHSLTRDQLEDALSDVINRISALESKHKKLLVENKKLRSRLAYHENADSPPSSDSLE